MVSLFTRPPDLDRLAEMARAERCLDAVFSLVIALDGTLSGEHGVGLEKREFVAREIDSATLRLMRGIKREFDPSNLSNPGYASRPDVVSPEELAKMMGKA